MQQQCGTKEQWDFNGVTEGAANHLKLYENGTQKITRTLSLEQSRNPSQVWLCGDYGRNIMIKFLGTSVKMWRRCRKK